MGDGLKRARDATRATRGLPPETPKLAEIAARIAAHLARFEADQALCKTQNIDGPRLTLFARPSVFVRGPRLLVSYSSALDTVTITKAQAIAYLAWLDAGGVGRHWEWERALSDGEDRTE